jgi:hypothetical protein
MLKKYEFSWLMAWYSVGRPCEHIKGFHGSAKGAEITDLLSDHQFLMRNQLHEVA